MIIMKQLNYLFSAFGTKLLMPLTLLVLLPAIANAQSDKKPEGSTCPDDHHPHMIDLGLPSGTKWACCNVGADSPEAYGDYFSWGETEVKDSYGFDTYEFFTGWNDSPWFKNIGLDISRTSYDVAYTKWGDSWQIPQKEQIQELIDNCTSEWITQNGVNGMLFIAENGNAIFLPASYFRWYTDAPDVGTSGTYWSSKLQNADSTTPWTLSISPNGAGIGETLKICGVTVRPVTPKINSDHPEVEGGWVERITNGSLEGDDTYNFGYYYYPPNIPSNIHVVDPDDATNHCIKMVKDDDSGMPAFIVSFSKNKYYASLYPGQKYKFSMRVKASQPTQIHSLEQSDYKWSVCHGLAETYNVPTEWTTIAYSGIVTDAQIGVGQLGFVLSDPAPVEYYFDDISFQVEMGDSFTATTEEGAELIFTVISEDEQTCAVGDLHKISSNSYQAITDTYKESTLTLPSTVEHNGKTYSVKFVGEEAFAETRVFDSIVIPEGVTHLCLGAFRISTFKTISIPSTVKMIGYDVFSHNYSLQSVYSYIEEPFPIEDKTFEASNGESVTLYVPAGTKEKYKATDGWKSFKNIVEMAELKPVDEGDNVNYGEGGDINDKTDLSGTVVNNMYYSIGTDAGGYSTEEGCIVITKETSDEQMELIKELGITDEELNKNFTGIIFKVPAGKGKVTVNAETTGNMTLKVKVGNGETVEMELEGKQKMKFPYNVSEESLVYIFAGTTDESTARGTAEEPASLKIYGIEWQSDSVKGDLNGDGNIDVGDIMAIINFMAAPKGEPEAYDLNNDGSVDVGDIMAIINIMEKNTADGE